MKNFREERFPDDFEKLIQKCEQTVLLVKERLNDPDCVLVKDLYLNGNGRKQKDFLEKLKVECNSKLNKSRLIENELQGLYIFGEVSDSNNITPVYVGISRTVFRRLYQHTWGTKHNQTSLSYLKAKHFNNYSGKRENLPEDLLREQQNKIKNYRVVVIPESSNYDLYFMEVYIAGKLKTIWNSFKTH